jgi:type VI secretion system protein ImpK
MSEPSADAMYRASVEALAAAAQIGDGRSLPSADALRQSMMALLADFVARCRNARIPDTEIAEARYAIVAFIDDRVLRSNWTGRTEWMSNPLQLQFFREYTAGENFFARMRALGQRGAPFWALEVYYTCIALGFVGALRGAGGQQSAHAYAEPARLLLLAGTNPTSIAPNAIPPAQPVARRRPPPVALGAVLACVALCVIALFALQFVLSNRIQRVTRDLTAAKAVPPSSSEGP